MAVVVQVSRVPKCAPPSTTALSPPIWVLFGLAYLTRPGPHSYINIVIVILNTLSDYTANPSTLKLAKRLRRRLVLGHP